MPETALSARPHPSSDVGHVPLAQRLKGEEAFRLLVEAVADYAIFLLDRDGCVVTWNLGARRVKGYTRDEIVGRHFSTFYTPEDRARGLPQRILAAAAADGRHETEGWRVRKDGSRFWADVVVTALRDDDGEVSGYAKVTKDLTERREAIQREHQLALEQRARAAAEEALRVRDRFLSIASHELRTPIASVQVASEALLRARRNGRLDEQRLDEMLRRIESAAGRLGTLASELLDVSRLESGAFELRMEPVEVGTLVSEAVAGLELNGDAGRVRVDVEPGLQVVADAARLDQVVVNLVDNALKYSSDQVRVRVARQDGGVVLEVADRGVGIDAEERDRLFEPFSRSADVTHIPGMGLGLYISREIVERHGGRIGAESAGPQLGTTFNVWLPASPAEPGATS